MDAIRKIEAVAWRRKDAGGWWVYYETKAHDDLEPLYDAQTLASKEAEEAAREAEIARLREALKRIDERCPACSAIYTIGSVGDIARAALTQQPPKD